MRYLSKSCTNSDVHTIYNFISLNKYLSIFLLNFSVVKFERTVFLNTSEMTFKINSYQKSPCRIFRQNFQKCRNFFLYREIKLTKIFQDNIITLCVIPIKKTYFLYMPKREVVMLYLTCLTSFVCVILVNFSCLFLFDELSHT